MTEIFETLGSKEANKQSFNELENSSKKIQKMKMHIKKIEKVGRTSPKFSEVLLKQKLSQEASMNGEHDKINIYDKAHRTLNEPTHHEVHLSNMFMTSDQNPQNIITFKPSDREIKTFDYRPNSAEQSNRSSNYRGSDPYRHFSPCQSINTEKSLFESVRNNSKNHSRTGSPKLRKSKTKRSPLKQLYYNQKKNIPQVRKTGRRNSPKLKKKYSKPKSFFKVAKEQLGSLENSVELSSILQKNFKRQHRSPRHRSRGGGILNNFNRMNVRNVKKT